MFNIVSYSRAALTSLFLDHFDRGGCNDTGTVNVVDGHIRDKHHIDYLDGFLSRLSCKTIVVEAPYVDRDFLDDFAAYHVRAFQAYQRFCVRLHFFYAHSNSANSSSLL